MVLKLKIFLILTSLLLLILSQDRLHPPDGQFEEVIVNDGRDDGAIPHHPGFDRKPRYEENEVFDKANAGGYRDIDGDVSRKHIEQEFPQRDMYDYPESYHERIHEMNEPMYDDMMDMRGEPGIPHHRKGNPREMHGGMYGGMPGDMPGGGMHQGARHGGMHGGMHHGSMHGQQQPQSFSSTSNNSWFSGTFGTIYEILMLLFLGGFIFNCIFGKTQNDKYALAWYNANKQYFEERYQNIGLNKSEFDELPTESKMKENNVMIKETPHVYKFYCSNYRYVKWSLTALEFRKRYDAVSMMSSLFMNDNDRIIYEVVFNPVEPLGWVFCVCKKRDASNLRKSYQDIDFFTKQYEPSIMNDRMTLLSENCELFMELFQNKNLHPYYKQIEEHLDIIYYTDQNTFCKEPFALFFSFEIYLTKTGQDRRLLEITHFVNLFVDTLAQLKYSPKAKAEFEKNRVNFERTKMEDSKRKEIEDKEKRDFIEKWKLKNKMKTKKAAERKKLEKELEKFK